MVLDEHAESRRASLNGAQKRRGVRCRQVKAVRFFGQPYGSRIRHLDGNTPADISMAMPGLYLVGARTSDAQFGNLQTRRRGRPRLPNHFARLGGGTSAPAGSATSQHDHGSQYLGGVHLVERVFDVIEADAFGDELLQRQPALQVQRDQGLPGRQCVIGGYTFVSSVDAIVVSALTAGVASRWHCACTTAPSIATPSACAVRALFGLGGIAALIAATISAL